MRIAHQVGKFFTKINIRRLDHLQPQSSLFGENHPWRIDPLNGCPDTLRNPLRNTTLSFLNLSVF